MRSDVSDHLALSFPFYCSVLLAVVVINQHILTELGKVMKILEE